jgi:hypothetical protein
MEIEGEGAAPYRGVVDLAAAPDADHIDPGPAAHLPWIRPIGDYERRVTSEIHGARYG